MEVRDTYSVYLNKYLYMGLFLCMYVCIVYALTPGLFIHACKYFNLKYLYVCMYRCVYCYPRLSASITEVLYVY